MDFRTTLFNAFQKRHDVEPGYTFRAFAEDLGWSPQRLNRVLKGKCGISSVAARDIVERLKLDQKTREEFFASVDSQHHRIKEIREIAAKKIPQSSEEELRVIFSELISLTPEAVDTFVESLKSHCKKFSRRKRRKLKANETLEIIQLKIAKTP